MLKRIGYTLIVAVSIFFLMSRPAHANFFGTNTFAGSLTGGGQSGTIVATRYSLMESGIVTSISIAIGNSAVTSIKVGLYTNSAGTPVNLIVANNTGVLCSANSFCTVPISPTFLTAGTYWISSLQNQSGSLLYFNGLSLQAAYNNVGGSTYAAGMNSTYPAVTYQNINYIAYASYSTYARVTVRNNTVVRKKTIIR